MNTTPMKKLTPTQVCLLLARLEDQTLVLIQRPDGWVDLEINPVLAQTLVEWDE